MRAPTLHLSEPAPFLPRPWPPAHSHSWGPAVPGLFTPVVTPPYPPYGTSPLPPLPSWPALDPLFTLHLTAVAKMVLGPQSVSSRGETDSEQGDGLPKKASWKNP